MCKLCLIQVKCHQDLFTATPKLIQLEYHVWKTISSILNCLGDCLEECLLLTESEVIFKTILFPGYSLVSVGMSDCIIYFIKVFSKNNISVLCVFQARRSNFRHRPIGLGVQGLADTFLLMRYPFESEEAQRLNKEIFETLYFAALDASCELAEKYGPYETWRITGQQRGRHLFCNTFLKKYIGDYIHGINIIKIINNWFCCNFFLFGN